MTKTSPFIFCVLPFALAGCFFATKSDFDNLQMQLIGARAGSRFRLTYAHFFRVAGIFPAAQLLRGNGSVSS